MHLREQTYTDRFGNEWSVRWEDGGRMARRLSFTCDGLRLVVEDEQVSHDEALTPEQLKELFCDAERVVQHGKETWYVGLRARVGRGGYPQAGVRTRFRSERGEVRYAKGVVHSFRHMPAAALCAHLADAEATVKAPAGGTNGGSACS